MEIKLKNVYFDYFKGTSLSKNVLNNVSLSLKCGRIIGITGESGSGKSTLAKVICGCIVPSSGSVSYDVNLIKVIFKEDNVGIILKKFDIDVTYVGDVNSKKIYKE